MTSAVRVEHESLVEGSMPSTDVFPAPRAGGVKGGVAQLMAHANVDTTLNVYTQVLDGSLREAVDKAGGELFTIVHKHGQEEVRLKTDATYLAFDLCLLPFDLERSDVACQP
jgi:hypothetical protein